jgi:hypothetical protein
MPAFITHFLVAKDVFSSSGLADTDQNRRYFLLGSVGPDLPYYRNVFGTAIGTFFEETFNPNSPGIYTGWGDLFHARTPNLFPLKMIETIRKDNDQATETQKLAFALGYLTHVAADQHIHPHVNAYAGPYYASGVNRKNHRTLEVYEDILVYEMKSGKKFFSEDFLSWFDVSVRETVEIVEPYVGPRTEERLASYVPVWLSSFIQRAFMEAYGTILDGKEVEKWVGGFASIFPMLKGIGPYHDACESMEGTPSDEAKKCIDFFANHDYTGQCFTPATARAVTYMAAATRLHASQQITETKKRVFLRTVADADLTSPLVDL